AGRVEAAAEGGPAVVHRPGEAADRAATAHTPDPLAASRAGQAVAAADDPGDALLMGIVRAGLPLVVDLVRRELALFFRLCAIADRIGRVFVVVVPVEVLVTGQRVVVVALDAGLGFAAGDAREPQQFRN